MVKLNKCSCGEIPEIGRDDLERYLVTCLSCLKKSAPYDDMGYRDWETDRKSTRLNSSHSAKSRMPSSA